MDLPLRSGLEVIKFEQSHVSASSQSMRFILSLRMNSSFVSSRPETSTEEETQAIVIEVQENDTNSPWAVILITLKKGGGELLKYAVMVTAYYMSSVKASKMNRWR